MVSFIEMKKVHTHYGKLIFMSLMFAIFFQIVPAFIGNKTYNSSDFQNYAGEKVCKGTFINLDYSHPNGCPIKCEYTTISERSLGWPKRAVEVSQCPNDITYIIKTLALNILICTVILSLITISFSKMHSNLSND